ncbi:hypothetical protein ABZV31_11915 [Streptomyces sp. NPDC005202]|uniref:hypothetical protein n=1 Tax=Streptomyces sp. NPDC005202 TaxID=3157021 RepID=UPI0033A70D3B
MSSDRESAHGINQIEGYLLWNAETTSAQQRAKEFTEQLPWLTTAQREEVERVYTADRLADSTEALQRIARRSAELKAEYIARYRLLRTRCVALSLAATAALGATAAVVGLLLTR